MKPKQNLLAAILGAVPVVWLALLLAPYFNGGITVLMENLGTIFDQPFQITLCDSSKKAVLLFLLGYALVLACILSNQKTYRRGEEHGSAHWGNAREVARKYLSKEKEQNLLLTKSVGLSLDGAHQRNLNVMIVGGSGAGKTTRYAYPNVMQANCSYVILDPKGEILRTTGNFLLSRGYKIKVLDLINMDKSHCYNPFAYVRNDNDVQKLVTNLFKNTTPKDSKASEPFWDGAASMLLMALICYLRSEAPPDEQNFSMVMELLASEEVKESNEEFFSLLDRIFERLSDHDPDNIALKYYRGYKTGAGKTLKSIIITLQNRLAKFNLDSLAGLTYTDELDLDSIGEEKTAVFAVIPDSDSSFNFVVGMLYTQLFQELYYKADFIYGGRLPIHVHFLMDEFANVNCVGMMRIKEFTIADLTILWDLLKKCDICDIITRY